MSQRISKLVLKLFQNVLPHVKHDQLSHLESPGSYSNYLKTLSPPSFLLS